MGPIDTNRTPVFPRSQLPDSAMAGTPDAWQAIAEQLRQAESGQAGKGQEVVIRPGGAVELVKDGEVVQPASRLPQDVMAWL